jgi:hypothetical protein
MVWLLAGVSGAVFRDLKLQVCKPDYKATSRSEIKEECDGVSSDRTLAMRKETQNLGGWNLNLIKGSTI